MGWVGDKEHSCHLQLLSPKSGFAASQASTVGSFLYLFTVGLLFFLPVSGAREG